MFGISFSELLLVGLVALLVLGPERLPGAARTAGLWVGRLKRSFNAIKQEVEREIGADEIRRQLHNEHILSMEQEARKLFSLEPTPAEPVTPPIDSVVAHVEAPAATPVVHTPAAANEIGPAAPSEAAHIMTGPSEGLVSAPTPVLTPAAASTPAPTTATAPTSVEPAHAAPAAPIPNAPSANDSSLPPRAP